MPEPALFAADRFTSRYYFLEIVQSIAGYSAPAMAVCLD
ncbi:hypothetical protein CAter282_0468 [Collimonas arenae]|uniref:Uncharacterized protein n=1 Tax=Collimonas arenae TaxID=279058 RepID=A0A127QE30_9BURK|nr:hypothetical protein CAter282_0468 [Collimonas arenae]